MMEKNVFVGGIGNMQRTLVVFNIYVSRDENSKKEYLLEDDFVGFLEDLSKQSVVDRRRKCSQEHKVLYLDSFEHQEEAHIINIKMKSAKYDSRRNVIDTETMTSRGILKGEYDGDEEANHMGLKFIDKENILVLFESNYYGIGFGRIVHYWESFIKKYHKKIKQKGTYGMQYKNVVSNDFLAALEKAGRIKAVTLTVDQENIAVSEVKALSGRNDLNSDVNIVLKPAGEGKSILGNTVRDFFKMYRDDDTKIKRIMVDADTPSKEPLIFDTEQMKEKIVINVEGTGTNEVDTESIYARFFEELHRLD